MAETSQCPYGFDVASEPSVWLRVRVPFCMRARIQLLHGGGPTTACKKRMVSREASYAPRIRHLGSNTLIEASNAAG